MELKKKMATKSVKYFMGVIKKQKKSKTELKKELKNPDYAINYKKAIKRKIENEDKKLTKNLK